ncbi:uncharacterized protein [Solanum tuberosum]|nr:PREDICTED: uncharacterized protein LOC102604356 isoform X1 [Solanum tuberosum]
MPLIVGTRNLVVSSSGSPSHLFLLVFLGDSIYYLHCYKVSSSHLLPLCCFSLLTLSILCSQVVGGHPKGSIRHACAYVASGCLLSSKVDVINNKMRAPWHVKHITDQITQLFGIKIFVFVHTFREENTLVDHLTNTGEVTKSHAIYYDFGSLPSKVKAMLMIDQQGFPHL